MASEHEKAQRRRQERREAERLRKLGVERQKRKEAAAARERLRKSRGK